MLAQNNAIEPPRPCDEAGAIIAYHGGDAVEAIRTLLAERDVLFERLLVARCAMGRGFTRGWKP